MESPREAEWLYLVFGPELSLALHPSSPTGRFRLGGVEYRAPDDNYLTAFYDRLVDPADRLIGIRIHPVASAAEMLIGRLTALPYLYLGAGYIDVFLTGSAVPDAESTGDQAFGGQVFTSIGGDVAISLDVHHFCASPDDLSALRQAQARWVDLET